MVSGSYLRKNRIMEILHVFNSNTECKLLVNLHSVEYQQIEGSFDEEDLKKLLKEKKILISKRSLFLMKSKLEERLDEKILLRKSKRFEDWNVLYKGKNIILNLRDREDWFLGSLLEFYILVEKSIKNSEPLLLELKPST